MSEGDWSIDIENAWAQLFKILVQMMSAAYNENETLGAFPSHRQSKMLLDSWNVIQNELDEVGIELLRLVSACIACTVDVHGSLAPRIQIAKVEDLRAFIGVFVSSNDLVDLRRNFLTLLHDHRGQDLRALR